MKRGRMQCKDIPNELVIQAVTNTTEKLPFSSWRAWRDVLPQFAALMPDVPEALFFAKVNRLASAGLVHACAHQPYAKGQCRGDLHLPDECKGC